MPLLPPLELSFEPVPINTTRRIYIQNLVNLLHHAIRTRNQPQASKAWGILIRCEEVDWRASWKWALPVFDLEVDAARRAQNGSIRDRRSMESDAVIDVRERKEQYLRRLLVSVAIMQKPEILATLVMHLIEMGQHQRALDDLELYLMTYPFILSASLHCYAGLLCFYLSQPIERRRSAERKGNTSLGPGRADSASGDESSNESDRSITPQPQRGPDTAESLNMNERLLRNALTHFTKALEREKEKLAAARVRDDGKAGNSAMEQDDRDKMRLRHGTAKVSRKFIREIEELLEEGASDDEDQLVTRLKPMTVHGQDDDKEEEEEEEEKDDDPVDDTDLRDQLQRLTVSPPTSPSTLAGKLSEIGLGDRTPRASSRRDPDKARREREDEEELSVGEGSVYSELSIG